MSAVDSYTKNFSLRLINFDASTWVDEAHNNMIELDALLYGIYAISGFRGVWVISTAYAINDIVVDPVDGYLYKNAAAHTSASSGIFSADRAANPTYWTIFTGEEAASTAAAEAEQSLKRMEGYASSFSLLAQQVGDVDDTLQEIQLRITGLQRFEQAIQVMQGLEVTTAATDATVADTFLIAQVFAR